MTVYTYSIMYGATKRRSNERDKGAKFTPGADISPLGLLVFSGQHSGFIQGILTADFYRV